MSLDGEYRVATKEGGYLFNFERLGLPAVPNPTYPFPLWPGRPSEVPGMIPPDAHWAAWETGPEE
jgi:hypothetical protein